MGKDLYLNHYLDSKAVKCETYSHMGNTIGMLTMYYKKFLISQFPNKFFKDIFISTTLASNSLNNTSNDDLLQRANPKLVITPEYTGKANETFFGSIPRWTRSSEIVFRDMKDSYYPVLYDDTVNEDLYIYSLPNRTKITFNTSIIVDTSIYKWNVVHKLNQIFQENDMKFINDANMNGMIPNYIILLIANSKGYNLNDESQVKEFHSYLKKYSNGLIRPKYNASSGNYLYMFDYKVNILYKVESDSTSSTDKDNMVEKQSKIELVISFECWTPSTYILETYKDIPEIIYEDDDFNGNIITTSLAFKTRPSKVYNGKVEVAFEEFITELNGQIDELIFDDSCLSKDVSFIYNYILNNPLDYNINDYFEIVVFRDMEKLISTDYEVNLINKSIVLLDPLRNYQYSFAVYLDMEKYNTLVKDLVHRKKIKINDIRLDTLIN